ncbi:MAG TPA: hypothetical protein DEQ20_01610 [Desulfobulbaceae bacterium]|nr:hypothetical protein [Desulfobulbaceae bacterium]
MNSISHDTGRKDLRPLVLVFFALCILAITGVRKSGFFERQGNVALPQKLVWRDDPGVAPGLYRVPVKYLMGDQSQAGPVSGQDALASGQLPARLAPLFFQPIPINQADEELLTTIPGIGPAFARRIIEFREYYGRINAIEELDAVRGVGPVKLEILKTHLVAD